MGKLVCGVGINDADYAVHEYTIVEGKQMMVWRCPFYTVWKSMLSRCYSKKLQRTYPTYIGCTVAEEWKTFSIFKAWMEQQDWEGRQLDKDLLLHSNKVYGPEYCVFVSGVVNKFMVEGTAARGGWPIGVSWEKSCRRFKTRCCNPFTRQQENLGRFDCPNEAHQAWLERKRELAQELAALQTDPRVAKALLDRYAVDVYTPLHEQG